MRKWRAPERSSANEHPWANECRYLINGEPTDNLLAIGTKGSLRFTLTTAGRAAHSAYPEQGESAIDKLLDVLEALRRCDWPVDDVFGETTCNIGVISGRHKTECRPGKGRSGSADAAGYGSRANQRNDCSRQSEAGRKSNILRSMRQYDSWLSLELPQCVVRFTTDIPYLTRWGTPLLLGPGSILECAHRPRTISKTELSRAVELYVEMARALVSNS